VRLRDGRRLGFAEWGRSSGRAVLYFHGAMGSPMRRCVRTEAALERLGLRYLLVHRPGFGRSDPRPGRTLLDWPDDVTDFADALGLARFAVLGVSAGGPYAAACAHRLPDRVSAAAVVSGLAPRPAGRGAGAGAPGWQRLGLSALRRAPRSGRALLGAVVHALRARPGWLVAALAAQKGRADRAILADDEARAIFIESFLAATEQGVAAMVEDYLLASGPWGFTPAQVSCEVQLWHGVRDTTVPVGQAYSLAAALPRCRAAFAPDAGHFFFRERMLEILATLTGSEGLSARVAPHEPQGRGTGRQLEALGDLEAVPRVEGEVALARGLEVGGEPLAVAALERRAQQG